MVLVVNVSKHDYAGVLGKILIILQTIVYNKNIKATMDRKRCLDERR
jgi:hypothetical protein